VLFWNRWDDESIDPNNFMRLTDPFLEANALSGSSEFLDSVLRPEAQLYAHSQAGRAHYFHVAPDRLLHRFDFGHLPLLVYENGMYITVRVASLPLLGEPPEAFVRRVMGALLNFSATWHFYPSKAPDESMRFSTDAAYTIELGGEAIDISGAIVDGGLYFTKHRSMVGDYSGRNARTARCVSSSTRCSRRIASSSTRSRSDRSATPG